MTPATIEDRLTDLEQEVAKIKQKLADEEHEQAGENWVSKISGSLRDHPDFDEFVNLGREFRQAQTDP